MCTPAAAHSLTIAGSIPTSDSSGLPSVGLMSASSSGIGMTSLMKGFEGVSDAAMSSSFGETEGVARFEMPEPEARLTLCC